MCWRMQALKAVLLCFSNAHKPCFDPSIAMLATYALWGIMSSDVPHLAPKDAKLLPVITQRLVAECGARSCNSTFERRVEPEAIVAVTVVWSVANRKQFKVDILPAPNTHEVLLAEDHIIIDTTIRKCLKPYSLRCARACAAH